MDRQQNTPVGLDSLVPRAGYRGPFTLGLSRLSLQRSTRIRTSYGKAFGCFIVAAVIGVITAHSLSNVSLPPPSSAKVVPSNGYTASANPLSLLGGIGLFLSASLGLAGVWFWPFKKRIEVQSRDEGMAAYDHVTGLPTLRLFTVLLDQALTRASQTGRVIGVLVAELQQFRPLPTSAITPNMSLIVRVQAARIKSALSPNSTVARIGERRFAVLIEGVEMRDHIDTPAQNIYRTMSLPLMIEGQEVLLTCQIGGAMYSSSITSGEALLSQAVKSLAYATSENPVRFAEGIGEVSFNLTKPVSATATESLLR